MKKFRQSRAVYASLKTYSGFQNLYYLVIPYDKKGREIPTSVNCAYNSEYYTSDQAMLMAGSL
jgi:hypothetical protein